MNLKSNFLKTTLALTAIAIFNPAQAAGVDLLATNNLHNTGASNQYSYMTQTTFDGVVNTNTNTSHFGAFAVTSTSNVPADPTSATGAADWISPTADFNTSVTNTHYTYRTTFDLTGIDPSSVLIQGGWASDNKGRGIYVNGVEIATYISGVSGADKNFGRSPLALFSISGTTDALLTGINTIDFVYRNGTGDSATGLYVEYSSASGDSIIPEPEIIVLIGLGALALRVTSSRKI